MKVHELNSIHLNGRPLGFQSKDLKAPTTLYGGFEQSSFGDQMEALLNSFRGNYSVSCVNSSTSALDFFRFYAIYLLIQNSFTTLVMVLVIILHFFLSGFTANWFVSSPEGLRNARTLLLVQFAKDDKFSSYFRIIFSNSKLISLLEVLYLRLDQGPAVQRLDNAIHWINRYPADSVVCFVDTYPLDSDLSGG